MLCEASAYLGFAHSFWLTWAVATALGVALVCAMSIPLFYYYYVSHNVTYEKVRAAARVLCRQGCADPGGGVAAWPAWLRLPLRAMCA